MFWFRGFRRQSGLQLLSGFAVGQGGKALGPSSGLESLPCTRQLDLGQPAAVDSQLRETAATGIERAMDSVIVML